MKTVTVWHKGNGLVLQKSVADDLGHYPGKELSEKQALEAIGGNVATGLDDIAKQKDPDR